MVTLSSKTFSGWLAGLCMVFCSLLAHAEEPAPVRIGWVNWSDTEIAVKLASTALQDHLKQPVKLVLADIGIQFQALANGNIDLIPMVWLPSTHKAFYDKYSDKLEDLGVLYEGRIGMAVPTSIAASEIASIEDLNKPDVREKLGGKILTSEVGNGQYKLTEKAIELYKLDGYKMVASSESGMLSELDRNLKRDKWSLVNAWSPHWMFSKWSLRYLDDPKKIFGGAEQIHAVARKGFSAEYPDVARFFTHFNIPQADLERLMAAARDSSADKVVAEYYAANKPRFEAMFGGQTASVTTGPQ
ncbi:glycine betaine ABC transporter substrate-binding protein [Pseudomonas sp. Fig-3]|jgi:glycine betaine/proline transport system substrate-binding protein|uniref:Glycine/betaine ABC transporter substrate-binding protein n=1 Tax=Pseudomonas rhizophila TaxID=2045200 RepID=A0ABN5K019_9PSED|nr:MULTISPECIES: glycine betaine ABC transporter substrate-binding protein [Pseudomonas]AVU77648.1 glycine/betaine ABC transporter substrate-binding protein [Pseudomonas rhizophila]MBD0703893.1 glycine/betaine ABC transporter substrate-binding protein [Pseudomonas sp. PSB1]MDR8389213.1 glycine betaine ABC transporter substrate-binding protein [Pseudomonas sp. JL2]MEA1030944.1 glycine betaine ABC transporter substrate-binding protein [Pseudomonas sp. N-137]QKJ36648.1 glycine betaine ABC transpo